MNRCWPTQMEIVRFVAMEHPRTHIHLWPSWYPFLDAFPMKNQSFPQPCLIAWHQIVLTGSQITWCHGHQHNANDNLMFKLGLWNWASTCSYYHDHRHYQWLKSPKMSFSILFCLGPEQVPSLWHDPAALPLAPARPWNCPQADRWARQLPAISWHQP